MDERLRDIQFVTRHYVWLQGLRTLPVGLVLLGAGLLLALLPGSVLAQEEQRRVVVRAVILVTLVLLLGAFVAGGEYYKRRIGEARPDLRGHVHLVVGILLGGVAGGLALLALWLGHGWMEVALLGLLAVLFAGHWAWMGRRLNHYLVTAGVVALWAVLEAVGLSPLGWLESVGVSAERRGWATLALVWGGAVSVTAYRDHRLLVSLLRAPAEESGGGVA